MENSFELQVAEKLGALDASVRSLKHTVDQWMRELEGVTKNAAEERSELRKNLQEVSRTLNDFSPDLQRCRRLRIFGIVGVSLIGVGGAIAASINHIIDVVKNIKFVIFLAAALSMIPSETKAHDHWDWVRNYSNGEFNCCDSKDVTPIEHWKANALSVGDNVAIDFPSGKQTVTIKKIYQTRDLMGRALITKWGCLFRTFGM